MSIALWADLDAAKKRIETLETRVAELAAENIVLAHRVAQIDEWIAARKPGPKSKDASCQ